jgi:DNA polymerase-3 subunit epsilon
VFAPSPQATRRWAVHRRATHAVIDVETTGLCPAIDAITEIAVVLLRDGRLMAQFTRLVDPGRPIPPDIVEMTGITDAMVAGSPPVRDVLPTVIELVSGAVVVGHNVLFDLGFLSQASAAEGLPPLANTVVCTADLSRKVLGEAVADHCLATVARHLEVRRQASHRALGDALVTVEVFRRLTELESQPQPQARPKAEG